VHDEVAAAGFAAAARTPCERRSREQDGEDEKCSLVPHCVSFFSCRIECTPAVSSSQRVKSVVFGW